MGGTDYAQPMIYAKKKNLKVDVFIVYWLWNLGWSYTSQ